MRLHNAEKCISTKTRNSLGDKVKGALTEIKMSRMRLQYTQTPETEALQFRLFSLTIPDSDGIVLHSPCC